MNEVKFYMNEPTLSIDSEASIFETVKCMRDSMVGSIFISENGQYVGIFTETDLLRKVVAEELTLGETKVSSVMSAPLISIDSGASMLGAFALMQQKNVRHLATTEKNKIVGVISIKDIANYYIDKFGKKLESREDKNNSA